MIQLDMIENQLLYLDTVFLMLECMVGTGIYFAGLFGMNLNDLHNLLAMSFLIVVLSSIVLMLSFSILLFLSLKWNFTVSFTNFSTVKDFLHLSQLEE
jgi:hypothetical protein